MDACPHQCYRETDHGQAGGARDEIAPEMIAILSHDSSLVDEQEHEREDERQQDSVGHLREENQLQQRQPGDQNNTCAEHNEASVKRVKNGRLLEAPVDSRFEAETFTNVVRGGKR